MSHFGKAIRSKGAKEAIGEGVLKFVETWDIDKAKDAMIQRAKKNGSMKTVKASVIADIIEAIIQNYKSRQAI